MKVSIITACFNRKGSITNAIESVLKQTYPDIEYIVVDGASTDGSVSVIEECLNSSKFIVQSSKFNSADSCHDSEKFEQVQSFSRCSKSSKFTVRFVSEPDHGMYEAINKGIGMATGDVIALCHSDDQLYDEHTVEKMVEVFERHPETDMVYADGVFVNEHGKAIRVWKGGQNRRWKLNCGWLPLHTTFYIKKRVFDKYGLYDESYRIAADTKMLLTLLYKERLKTAYLNRYVVRMLMGGKSTAMNRQQEMWQEDVRVFQEIGFKYPRIMKTMKMAWKPMQFVRAKFADATKTIR